MAEIPELTNEQRQELLERLALYALRKFQLLGWAAKHTNCAGPGGKGPEDIASEAITKVINGDRPYNPEKYPVFMDFLKSIVDSRISHLADSFERKNMVPIPVTTNEQGDCEEIEFEGKETTSAKICINKEIAEKVKTILAEEFKDDSVVNGLLECFEAGYNKPAEISELLGIDNKEIYNAQKRLQRVIDKKLQNFKMEYGDGK
jgi:hypothetical protein